MTKANCIHQKNKLNNAEDKADFDAFYKELRDADIPADEAFTQAAEQMLEQILEERNELAADVRHEGGYLEDISIEQLLAPEKKEKQEVEAATKTLKTNANTKIEDVGEKLGGAKETDAGVAMFSRSAMKSVDTNIKRGLKAMEDALIDKTTIHRAMYRSGLGWVDFVWGSEGSKPNSRGKRLGTKGISHILDARMNKDGLTESEAIETLESIVVTIAKGEEINRTESDNYTRVKLEHDGVIAMLVRRKGSNAWLLTGFEIKTDDTEAANDSSVSTHSKATLSRQKVGADNSNIDQKPKSDKSIPIVETHAILDDLAPFSRRHFLPKNTVWGSESEISQLYDGSLGGGKEVVVYRDVSKLEIRKAKKQLGVDLSGYSHSVSKDSMIHVDKQHANEVKEQARGQLPIKKQDYVNVPMVTKQYDQIVYGVDNKSGQPRIFYLKKMKDGTSLVIEEVFSKRKELRVKSVRKYPSTIDAASILKPSNLNVRNDTEHNLKIDQSEAKSKSIPIVETHAILDDLAPFLSSNFGRTRDVSDVVVAPDFASMPEAIQQEADKQGSDGSDVYGVFHKGKIYLNNANMTSREVVERTLFHEATHKGLRTLLGDKQVAYSMNKLMMAIGGSQRFNKLADELGVDLSAYEKGVNGKNSDGSAKFTKAQREQILIEELLAHIGEKGSKGLKQKVLDLLGAIRAWLRKMGFTRLAELGASDLSYLAKQAREAGLNKQSNGNEGVRFMFEHMVKPATASVMTQNGGEFDVSFSKDPFQSELEKLAELEEPIILDHNNVNDGIDYEAEKSLFLSSLPKRTIYRASTTRTAQAIRAASDLATNQHGGTLSQKEIATGRRAYPKTSLGRFKGYESVARIVSHGNYSALHIEYIVDDQVAAGKDDSPALTVIVEKDGELTIHGPAKSSDAFEWMQQQGLADDALDANGEPAFGGVDLQGFTRLEGVTRKQLLQILGDVHSRTKAWKDRKQVGLKWKRATGAKGGSEQDGSAVFFSRQSSSKKQKIKRGGVVRAAIQDIIDTGSTAFGRQRWGFLTLRQIAEQIKPLLPSIKRDYAEDVSKMETVKNQWKSKAGDIAGVRRKQLNKDENDQLSKMQHEATIAGIDPDKVYVPVINKADAERQIKLIRAQIRGRSGENTAIKMAEINEIENKVKQENNRLEVRDGIYDRWHKLSKEQQAIYRAERDFHKDLRSEQQQALLDRIALSDVDESVKSGLMDSLRAEFEKNSVEEPYFPLARFGQFWIHAEQDGETSYDMFETSGEWERYQEQLIDEGATILGAGRNINEVQKEAGISAKFVGQVEALVRELGDDPQVDMLRDSIYQLYLQSLPEMSSRKHALHRSKTKGFYRDHLRAFAHTSQQGANMLGRLKYDHLLRATLDDAKLAVDMASHTDAYKQVEFELESLRAYQAKQMEDWDLKEVSLGLRGVNKDAPNEKRLWQEFKKIKTETGSSEHSTIDASLQIKIIKKRIKRREDLIKTADGIIKQKGQKVASAVLEELNLTHYDMMNEDVNRWASLFNAMGFTWFLGASPAAGLVNMFQTPVVALPLLGAKFGYSSAAKEMKDATTDFFKQGDFSLEKSLRNDDERDAFQQWYDQGLLDKTLAHDLQGISDAGINTGEFKHKFMGAMGFAFHHAERANREITAIAAYRAARKKGLSHSKAVEVAREITWDSHFDYASSNRARFMRGNAMRVLTQFKQYSQNITYLYVNQLKKAFKGATVEEKEEARRALYGMFALQFSVAGALGLPMVGFLVSVINALIGWDDDEPKDLEAEIRQLLADNTNQTIGKLLSKGVIDAFTPVAMHGRLTLSDLWVRTSDRELQGTAHQMDLFKAVLGPMASIGTGFISGAELMKDGKLERGIEQMLPKFIKNPLQALRYSREDARSLNGIKMKDMSADEVFVKMMGFASSDLSDLYDQSNTIRNLDNRLKDRRNELIERARHARMNKDLKASMKIQKEIRRFNEKNPGRKITGRTIIRSMKSRQRMEQQMNFGIRKTRSNRDLLGRFDFAG